LSSLRYQPIVPEAPIHCLADLLTSALTNSPQSRKWHGFHSGNLAPLVACRSGIIKILCLNLKRPRRPSGTKVHSSCLRSTFGLLTPRLITISHPNRTNSFLLNPSVSYHFDDGWAVSSSPKITANWIAKGAKWTVPIGGGFSKAGWLGEQPAKLGLDAYYDAVRPKPDNDTWLVQLTLTFLFPN